MTFRKYLGVYLSQSRRLWSYLPASFHGSSAVRAYGRHLHGLVCRRAGRWQNHATFFIRNRAELELMRRLMDQKASGSSVDMAVLACSKGAEVYSILWTIRSARPDLRLRMHAVDISEEIIEFAARGIYSRKGPEVSKKLSQQGIEKKWDVTWNSCRDQGLSMFARMADEEVEGMFEVEGDHATVRSWLKDGITWLGGDAGDPKLVGTLGFQDVVVANRFLCHMEPLAAEKCLRNIARLVKPGGYLFVSGIDLDVRTKVAREMGWKPVTELMREVHEGDYSLTDGWPWEYWGLEPFGEDRSDWRIRYASVFQIGETVKSEDGDCEYQAARRTP